MLSVSACLHAPTPDSRLVDDFNIEGTKAVDEDDIKEKVLTTESSWLPWWVPFLGKAGWYDPLAWQADLRRVQRYYETQGFYDAQVLEEAVTELPNEHVRIKIEVQEGVPFLISNLKLLNVSSPSESEPLDSALQKQIEDKIALKVGKPFLESDWAQGKLAALSELREAGYAEATVAGTAQVSFEKKRVEAFIEMTPGARFHFGKIFITPAPGAQIPEAFVTDIIRGDLAEDRYFSESALKNAQARLFQQGVFSGVRVTRGASNVETATVPVQVDLREAPFRSLRAGFGASGDLNRNEVRFLGEYVNRNVGFAKLFNPNLVLDKLTLKLKFGWAFVPNIVEVILRSSSAKQGPVGSAHAEYEVPRIFGFRTLSLLSSIEGSRVLDNAIAYFGGEARAGVKWQPLVELTVTPSIRFSMYQLNNRTSVRDNVPQAALGCPVEPSLCLMGIFDFNVEYDKRDKKLEATQGFYLGLSSSFGLSQSSPFIKVVPEARGYVSFGPEDRFTIAGKIKVGTIFAESNNTPILVRFFSGGSAMRGFDQRRLSPLVGLPALVSVEDPTCATPTCNKVIQSDYVKGETQPIGGNGLAEFSLELRARIHENWAIAAFNDWGLVTINSLGNKTDIASSLYSAVGVGVRYLSALGPIRADVGFRLPFIGGPQNVDKQQLKSFQSYPGCFGIGAPLPAPQADALPYAGAPDGLCHIHLSIGEAF
jgi:translocation and assembly module TamA